MVMIDNNLWMFGLGGGRLAVMTSWEGTNDPFSKRSKSDASSTTSRILPFALLLSERTIQEDESIHTL